MEQQFGSASRRSRESLGQRFGCQVGSVEQRHTEGRKGVPRGFGGPWGWSESLWASHSHVWQSCLLSPQQCPSAQSALQSGPVQGGSVSRGCQGGWNGTPRPLPGTTNPPGHSQLRVRVASTWISLRNSLCRWRMSLQRMVSWKQSSGFLSMSTPPFRISVGGQVGGVSMGTGGSCSPVGTPSPW